VRDAIDRAAFRMRLDETAVDYRWQVFAWCLMTTHQHFVLRAPEGCISGGMQELNSRHAVATNRRHGRRGHLYENRFFSVEVATDAHFIASTAYVNRNPLAALAVERAEDWRGSSYRPTMGFDPAPAWLDVDFVLSMFGRTREKARAELADRVYSGRVPASEALEEVRRYESRGFLPELEDPLRLPEWVATLG
jgi:REP-associated tyrosine transposase